MLKAGSLYYALILMLLIGIVLSVLLITSSTDQIIKTKLSLENELIDFNDSSEAYAMTNFNRLDSTKLQLNPFDNYLKFSIKRKNWGVLDLLYSEVNNVKDTIKKISFVGQKRTNNLALYLVDLDKPLYLFNTKIKGNVYIPNANFSKLQINNHAVNKNIINGKINKSTKELPKINDDLNLFEGEIKKINFENLEQRKLKNEFDKITNVIYLNKDINLEHITISGKYIIKSFDSICIKKTAKLENVIIQSPKIYIEKGFKGAIQIIASKKVYIDEDVHLENPSIIYLKNEVRNKETTIEISSNSTIEGGIFLLGNTNNINDNNLIINENASVIGTVYSKGNIELKGTVFGTVYTNKFILDTGDAKYNNAIKDGIINILDLPKDFVSINLIKNENVSYEILKHL